MSLLQAAPEIAGTMSNLAALSSWDDEEAAVAPLAPDSPAAMTRRAVLARKGHEQETYLPDIPLPEPDALRSIAAAMAPGESRLVARVDDPCEFTPEDLARSGDRVRLVLRRTSVKIKRRPNGDLSVIETRAEHRIGHTGPTFDPETGTMGPAPEGSPRMFSNWRTATAEVYTARPAGYWIHQWRRPANSRQAARWQTRLIFDEPGRRRMDMGAAARILPTPAALGEVYPLVPGYEARLRESRGDDRLRVDSTQMAGPLHPAFLGATDIETVARRLFGRAATTPSLVEAVEAADLWTLAAVARFRGLAEPETLIEALASATHGDRAPVKDTWWRDDARRFARVLRHFDDGASPTRLLCDHLGTSRRKNRLPGPVSKRHLAALAAGRIRLGPVSRWEDVSARLGDLGACFDRKGRIHDLAYYHDTPAEERIEASRSEAGLRLRYARTMAEAWEWGTATAVWGIAGRAPHLLGCFDEHSSLAATLVLRQGRAESLRVPVEMDGTGYGASVRWEIEDHLRALGVDVSRLDRR